MGNNPRQRSLTRRSALRHLGAACVAATTVPSAVTAQSSDAVSSSGDLHMYRFYDDFEENYRWADGGQIGLTNVHTIAQTGLSHVSNTTGSPCGSEDEYYIHDFAMFNLSYAVSGHETGLPQISEMYLDVELDDTSCGSSSTLQFNSLGYLNERRIRSGEFSDVEVVEDEFDDYDDYSGDADSWFAANGSDAGFNEFEAMKAVVGLGVGVGGLVTGSAVLGAAGVGLSAIDVLGLAGPEATTESSRAFDDDGFSLTEYNSSGYSLQLNYAEFSVRLPPQTSMIIDVEQGFRHETGGVELEPEFDDYESEREYSIFVYGNGGSTWDDRPAEMVAGSPDAYYNP